MELIYSDENGIEIGEVLDYDLDTAIGKDENTFTLTIPLGDLQKLKDDNRPISEHYRIYANNTELGGVVDTIAPDTGEDTVVFEGRTWTGIIDGKILEPPTIGIYYIVNGEANAVLTAIISKIGLSGLFSVSSDISTVTIKNYQFERYTSAYVGICKMLYANGGKLELSYYNSMVHLSVVPMYDYSQTDEFDSSQLDFGIKQNYRPVNHLIMMSGSDLDDNHVIHLFTDANGGVQPYALNSAPYRDEHYILDKRNQVMTGIDEVTQVSDSGSSTSKSNYLLLASQPDGWADWWLDTSFIQYYTQNDDKTAFNKNELTYIKTHVLQTSQPSDWTANYAAYFTRSATVGDDGDYTYSAVSSVDSYSFTALGTAQPSDWDDNYTNYYIYTNDGTGWAYKAVQGTSVTKYQVQTVKPSDWNTNYGAYYSREQIVQYKYEVLTKQGTTWVKTYEYEDTQVNNIKTATYTKTFVKKVTKRYQYNAVTLTAAGKIPKWTPKTYYVSYSENVIPAWSDNYFYYRVTTPVAPTWTTNKYYTETKVQKIPAFETGTYYQKFEDHYQTLVEKGIDILAKSYDCDTIEIELDTDYEYDINDVVGARERVTGIFASQPIIKKIYKIKNQVQTITYEIGAWS